MKGGKVKLNSHEIVKVLDWNGNYLCDAYIKGIEYIKGKYGWFTSVTLLSLTGKKMYAWENMIAPYTLMLENKRGSR